MIKQIIYKTGAIFSLVAFAMWFGRDFDYEPLIGIVGSIVALICAEKYSGISVLNKWDKRLAQKFLAELPSSSFAIGLLQEHDFNGSFLHEEWTPIGKFYCYWTDPDHEFGNKKLNKKMKEFLSAILELKKLIGTHTSPMDNSRLQKIHSHAGEKVAQEINDKATDAFARYSEFYGLLKKYNFEPGNREVRETPAENLNE